MAISKKPSPTQTILSILQIIKNLENHKRYQKNKQYAKLKFYELYLNITSDLVNEDLLISYPSLSFKQYKMCMFG